VRGVHLHTRSWVMFGKTVENDQRAVVGTLPPGSCRPAETPAGETAPSSGDARLSDTDPHGNGPLSVTDRGGRVPHPPARKPRLCGRSAPP
jgi:hypothetical protein